MKSTHLLAVVVSLSALIPSYAQDPVFTNWTTFIPSTSTAAGDGTALGTITFGGDVVAVSYSGEVRQGNDTTTTVSDDSSKFYSTPGFSTPADFTPPLLLSDLIANDGGDNLHTILFGEPVVDPRMHIASLGDPTTSISWTFSSPFSLLSSNSLLTVSPGNILNGVEGFGTIQFIGTFSQISWSSEEIEETAGFQVGAQGIAVPETNTASLLLLSFGLCVRRNRRDSAFR